MLNSTLGKHSSFELNVNSGTQGYAFHFVNWFGV